MATSATYAANGVTYDMKYTIEQIKQGDDELILRYQNLNQEVEHIINFMSFAEKKLVGTKDGLQVVIDVKQILYIESVDRKTFVYLEEYKTCCTMILMK